MNFTENQQQCIDVTKGQLLVSAAAGSGKTAVLTQRVVEMLVGENKEVINADKLCIVTFTKSASIEMRHRITSKLDDILRKDLNNEVVQKQLLLLPTAQISTIHSLCKTIIDNNSSEQFTIGDQSKIRLINSMAIQEVLEKNYDDGNQAFLDLVEYVCIKDDSNLINLIEYIYEFIRSYPFPFDYLDDCLGSYSTLTNPMETQWLKLIVDYCNSGLNEARLHLKSAITSMENDVELENKYLPAFQNDVDFIDALQNHINDNNLDSIVKIAEQRNLYKKRIGIIKEYNDVEFLDELKNKRKYANDIVNKLINKFCLINQEQFFQDNEIINNITGTLFEIVKDVYNRIDELKAEQGVLDYSDLEHKAVKLLCYKKDNDIIKSDIAIELSSYYEQIMIDECQDINEIQQFIFEMISKEKTNLFMVGDVKQSIYRFRKAMPTLFVDKMDTFQPYNETHNDKSSSYIVLDQNFRSRKSVCEFCNRLFGLIMSKEVGEIDYTNREFLNAGTIYPEHSDDVPEVVVVEGSELSSEAEYIAHRIRKMVDEKFQVKGTDGNLRRCEYGDFAIIIRTKKERTNIYADALTEYSIPAIFDETQVYFDRYEIKLIINLLKVLSNPVNDMAMLSVLMSPLFGLSSDDIIEMRILNREQSLYVTMINIVDGIVECSTRLKEILTDTLNVIKHLTEYSVLVDVEQFIDYVYYYTSFIDIISSTITSNSGAEQKRINLMVLLKYANEFCSFGDTSLSEFLKYIDDIIANKSSVVMPNLVVTDTNAVKILSIHSSKGLEFPICFIADCSKKFNMMDTNKPYLFNNTQGFGIKIVDRNLGKSHSNLPLEAIKLKEKKEIISEEMRCLYVALTRAKEKLICVGLQKDLDIEKLSDLVDKVYDNHQPITSYSLLNKNTYLKWILELVNHSSSSCKFSIASIEPVSPSDKKVKVTRGDGMYTTELNEVFNYTYKNQQLVELPVKVTPTKIAKAEITKIVELPDFMKENNVTPALRGSTFHKFMQHVDYNIASTNLEQEFERLLNEEFMTEFELSLLDVDKIKTFFISSLFEQIQTSQTVLREHKFIDFIKPKDAKIEVAKEYADTDIIVQGIADCIIINNGKATIIDYKTDRTNNLSKLKYKYKKQLQIYRNAITKQLDVEIDCCILYSLYNNQYIKVT